MHTKKRFSQLRFCSECILSTMTKNKHEFLFLTTTYRGLQSTEQFESDKTSLVCCSFNNSIIYSYILYVLSDHQA